MAKEFDASHGTVKEIAQGLLEVKKMARSIENSALAFEPLANEATTVILLDVQSHARDIDGLITGLYRAIAKEAAKDA